MLEALTGLAGPSGQDCNCQAALPETGLKLAEREQDEKCYWHQQGNCLTKLWA